MSRIMKALVTAPGSTAVVDTLPIPEPSANEIRVKVYAVALNPVDALYVAHPPDQPGRVVGSDFAGVVDKLGTQVTGWKVGDRVASFLQGATSGNPRPGAFSEYAIVEEDLLIRIPTKVSFEQAATYPLCSLTAAQAIFIRLGIKPPFTTSSKLEAPVDNTPQTILVYSGATSLGNFCISLLHLLRTTYGRPYRIFATASPKHHQKLLALGIDGVFDYNSSTWVEDMREASGSGISLAIDCISEGSSTELISQTFGSDGGKIAVVRKSAWHKDGIREDVIPIYSAVWWGLGHKIIYNDEIMPANPPWRAFTVAFFRFLSAGSNKDSEIFPVPPSPIRLMPGGLAAIVDDAFPLLGSGRVVDRSFKHGENEWLKPISGEKMVYVFASI